MSASHPQSLHPVRVLRCLTVAAVTLSLAGSAFVAAPGAQGAIRPRALSIASALPSAKHCVSGHQMTIQVPVLRRVTWSGATVALNGKRVKTIRRSQVTRPVTLTGLPLGRFVVSIIARTSTGRRVTAQGAYNSCLQSSRPAPKPPKPVPAPAPPIVVPTVPAAPAPLDPAPGPASPGSYSGATSQGRGVSFYVSADGRHLQDVSIPIAGLGCTPGNGFYDQLAIADITIAADGSFTATAKQTGTLYSTVANFSYSFSGHIQGTTATGAFREDIAYDNGTAYSCTTNNQTWSTKRDTQGAQAASSPSPGSYSGGTSQSRGVSFYVSADGRHLQDVSIPIAGLGCTPGNGFYDQLAIADITIAADGSFTATATQTGSLYSSVAQFTYTFSGHFHGPTTAGVPRVAGMFREDISYDNGTGYSCTTNNQTWSTTRDTQGAQALSSPSPGKYSGGTSQSRGVSFAVSADGKHVQDVSIPIAGLGCTPGSGFYDQLAIADITIAADGSFTATATQTGTHSGAAATFTYRFSGHFHGPTTAGAARAAGSFREDIAYDNGTAFSCTTNNQTWSATHS